LILAYTWSGGRSGALFGLAGRLERSHVLEAPALSRRTAVPAKLRSGWVLVADAGCRSAGCATAESNDQHELADRRKAIALSRRLPAGMLAEFVNRPLFAWSRRASGRPRDDATHVAGDRRGMPAPSQFRPWRDFKCLTTLGFPRRFPIVQFSNAPLIIAFLAGEAAAHIHEERGVSRTTWLNVKALRRFPRVEAGWRTPGGGAAMPIARAKRGSRSSGVSCW
jgi:hypothetical protein